MKWREFIISGVDTSVFEKIITREDTNKCSKHTDNISKTVTVISST